jgi:hypothetical protein
VPPPHRSLTVQALPSSQVALLLTWMQPVTGLHAALVQTLPSSWQVIAEPPEQVPPLQTSLVVQTLLSLHGPVLFACVHPMTASQTSSVQALLSLQLTGVPPWHRPSLHRSFTVQALPSLHVVPACFGV